MVAGKIYTICGNIMYAATHRFDAQPIVRPLPGHGG